MSLLTILPSFVIFKNLNPNTPAKDIAHIHFYTITSQIFCFIPSFQITFFMTNRAATPKRTIPKISFNDLDFNLFAINLEPV